MRWLHHPARRTALHRAAGAFALGLAVAGAGSAGPATPGPPRAGEVERLRSELSLAESGAFYLRLDPSRRVLELALRGVVLQSHALRQVERGTPRIAFWPLSEPADWDRVAHAKGRMDPPRERERLEIAAGGDAAAKAHIPPTAEEAVSVPERWRVYFDTGLSLEIRARGSARNRGLLRRAADRIALWRADWRLLARGAQDRAWLRVELDPDDAASLFRSLPPEVGLVFAAGDSR